MSTYLVGINDKCQIIGNYFDGTNYADFIYSSGVFSPVYIISGVTSESPILLSGTSLRAINDNGDIAGIAVPQSKQGDFGFIAFDPAGVRPPTPLDLAYISAASYSAAPPNTVGLYSEVQAVVGDQGFAAVAYKSGNQLVIAFRGTDITDINNWIADASWLTGPNADFEYYVQQAAQFVYDVVNSVAGDTPNVSITLTGHSLGGAIAELLASAGGFRAVTFNSPGPNNFVTDSNLISAFDLVKLLQREAPDTITSYRLDGDGVSVVGSHIGNIVTLPSDKILIPNLYSEHLISSVIAQLQEASQVACFAEGTLVKTPEGEVPVERLNVGDLILANSGKVKTIRWIGHRHVDLTRHPKPQRVQPIRLAAGAFANGKPKRDLLVSPDHAIFIDGMLIPAKLLINWRSIIRETSLQKITYYHVELDSHDILLAEGLPAESYLDTGNRRMFEGTGLPICLYPDFANSQRNRETGSCAPFVTDPTRVEPIWRTLAKRASNRKHVPSDRPKLTDEADFHLLFGHQRLEPIAVQGRCYTFLIPGSGRSLRLMSRAARPCDARPWIEDARMLGVMICRIRVRWGDDVEDVPVDHPGLNFGWWAVERHADQPCRWTNGDALLPPIGNALLDVELTGSMQYHTISIDDIDDMPDLQKRGTDCLP